MTFAFPNVSVGHPVAVPNTTRAELCFRDAIASSGNFWNAAACPF